MRQDVRNESLITGQTNGSGNTREMRVVSVARCAWYAVDVRYVPELTAQRSEIVSTSELEP